MRPGDDYRTPRGPCIGYLTQLRKPQRLRAPVEDRELFLPLPRERELHAESEEAAPGLALPWQCPWLRLPNEVHEGKADFFPARFIGYDNIQVAPYGVAGRRDGNRLGNEFAGILLGHPWRHSVCPGQRPVLVEKRVDALVVRGWRNNVVRGEVHVQAALRGSTLPPSDTSQSTR